mmetsp:Transcript_41034/g.49790  ORF Transcript_41034/g.49790 Transcript_41034/m.49790 type:complete len:422 (+) Transcript_41034:58-1323(+)|eukprot:CAMPEP_0197847116 /NCGR_PEP_ID=MMETSP1438-20131217/5213_1 /TAXON_ID=1461541 /ORGANISM="Pterosperma sp., Strain CCMP1384" /LENGTH=421 /DNA_ID=CAMNT_0043458947 /DNA_START=58 /DNA_END=1323 /DNA_ORIENTATION=-
MPTGNPYGEGIPFGDPTWYRKYNSPYYKQTHIDFRDKVRAFTEKELMPYCAEWDEGKKIPIEVFQKCYAAGLLPGVVGAWPTEYAGPGPKDWDHFHELILIDEICRCGSGGTVWGLVEGLQIGLPPVLHFGSDYLKKKVAGDCLKGNKVICLNITEPTAGSDVANIKTTAVKDPTGSFYIVNGQKKWITNGMFADYFTVAVRTGGKGKDGISMLLLERNMPGIKTTQMKCTGVWASGTAYVEFDDVKVPVENLIGKENDGFKQIMYNFNHERWGFIVQANRFARVCMEEAVRYATKRRTFGKKLIEHPIIRWKIAEMARQVESTHAMLEQLTYQMCTMTLAEQNAILGGDTALIKVQATKVFEYCAREAAQIFGGASYVQGGQGEKVERLYREVRAYAIPGGSEEIMLDLGVKQAMRLAKL